MSVNGWFRTDPNSWHATGIPVGHPDRYKSRGVIRTSKDSTIPFEHQELGVPLRGKHIETEAEKELLKLLQRQLDTSIDPNTNDSRFSSAKVIENLGNYTPGLKTLAQLRDETENNKRPRNIIEEPATDISSIVEAKKSKRSLANMDHLRQETIEEQKQLPSQEEEITQLKYDTEQPISRHALEIERALLINRKNVPLAHLYVESQASEETTITDNLTQDIKEQFNTSVSLPPDSIPPTEEEIMEKKISIEEIKKIPKFAGYTIGLPSKKLCIKNIHKKVNEVDILLLFQRYQRRQQEKIRFKLMRGQALVTFADTQIATEALELINGYMLKGKPLILEYGKIDN